MDRQYWHKQTTDQPLFPDLIWSRPENRSHSGKLLIVGGNVNGFAATGEAYAEAESAGIGTARVLLPDSLQKTVGRVFKAGEYAPSTPSGSFSQKALSEILDLSKWADGVLWAGDLGRNSETAILLDKFIAKYQGQLTLTNDAADNLISGPELVLSRQHTLLVLSLSQLQKLAVAAGFSSAFTSTMDFLRLIESLHEFTLQHQLALVVHYNATVLVAIKGKVSTTPIAAGQAPSLVKLATHAAVWGLQNPDKRFEALSTSVL